MDRQRAEKFMEELRDLCRKHNIRITAVCESESIFGELLIEGMETNSAWKIQDVNYHEVFQGQYRNKTPYFYVHGAW